jgi:hypothetical protein
MSLYQMQAPGGDETWMNPRLPNRRSELYDPLHKGVAKHAGPEGAWRDIRNRGPEDDFHVNRARLRARPAGSADRGENNQELHNG